MDFGPKILAQVWSFSNQDKDIPYLISYEQGKRSIKMMCNCPAYSFRKKCKHIIGLKQGVETHTILLDKRYILSDIGMEVLKIKSLE